MMSIGFIGFGEAAASIAIGLKEEGCGSIFCFDTMQNSPPISEKIVAACGQCKGTLLPSSVEVCRRAKIVFCAVPAAFAVKAAEDALEGMSNGLIYVDVTTASPAEKKQISRLIEARGAKFVDAAMMGTLLKDRHKVPMYLCGSGTVAFCQEMAPYHMNLTPLEGDAGTATSIKFIRSITAKGLSCLLFESLQAAHHFGVEELIVESLLDSFGQGFENIINGYVSGAIIHAQRREHEMQNVVDFLQQEELPCVMAQATREKLQWIHDIKTQGSFKGEAARNWRDILNRWTL